MPLTPVIAVVMFYKVTTRAESVSTEPLLLGEIQGEVPVSLRP